MFPQLNESQIFESWAPQIQAETGITDKYKVNWLSKYCHNHTLNESFSGNFAQIGVAPQGNVAGLMGAVSTPGANLGIYGASGSGDKFPSLLPLSIQVAARTIGFDIVNVIPMSGPTGVLTYLDYIYGGGNTNTYDKPLVIKLSVATAYTTPAVGADFSIGTTTTFLNLKYIGKSRIDGQGLFKVVGPAATAGAAPTIADALGATGSTFYSGAGITGGSAIAAGSAVTPVLVKAFEDHIQGFTGAGDNNDQNFSGPFADATSVNAGMSRATGESTYFNNMGMKVYTKFIEAKTYQVAASVTTEQIQDLNKQYGIDVVSMVENALVNDISQAINKTILSKAFALGWLNNSQALAAEGINLNVALDPAYTTANVTATAIGPDPAAGAISLTVPVFSSFGTNATENQYTIQRRILSKVLAAGNVVAQRGRRGPANFIVTNLQLGAAIQDNAQFQQAPISNTINQNNGSLYPVGTIAGMTLYIDPNMKYNDNRVLVGRKGGDSDPGLKFMPYLMAESIQTISEGTMSPKIAVKSRFALVEAGQLPQTQYYTFYVHTGNIQIV